jgi:hypothetical protein
VADGKIAAATIDTAYNRIQQLKQRILTNISRSYAVTVPSEMHLEQNYPNPFNSSTQISFSVPRSGRTSLTVYNTLGQSIATLFQGEAESGMTYRAQFQAHGLPSGIYLLRLEQNGQFRSRKMLYLQ